MPSMTSPTRRPAPDGETVEIHPFLDRAAGVIDFAVLDANGNLELSRSRLLETRDKDCVLIHLAVRWSGLDDRTWEEHKRGTDSDLVNAKRIIEAAARARD
jgi:hypothetical protein